MNGKVKERNEYKLKRFPSSMYQCVLSYRQLVFSNINICAAAGVMVVHTIV